MVAAVTGNTLGLAGGSKAVLGDAGQIGTASLGQGGESVYVNAKTGNLVVQRLDELLAGRGPDLGTVRTYNSDASFDFDNNDGWQISLYRKLYALTGTANTAGSTIQRAGADGAQFTYEYDAATGKYINRDGSGAYDTLSYDAATDVWTWIDGKTLSSESYAASPTAGEWRIDRLTDPDGNAATYAYDANGLISQITDANGEITSLEYDASTKQLLSVDVLSGGVTTTRTRYAYDANGRLASVTTDLTPGDGSITDGNTYTTNYAYDGASNRLVSIVNSDGTQLTIAYDANFRVSTLTDGAGKATTFTYQPGSTTVSDPLGYATTLSYDAEGNLVQLQGPAGSGQDVRYTYDASGNLIQLTDNRSNTISYSYDASGNVLRQQDSQGNLVTRTYDSNNRLLTETTYATPDTDGAGPLQAADPQTTTYVYDSNEHLRFTISPEGRVTEARYDGHGQQTATIAYSGATFAVGTSQPAESELAAWVAAQNLTNIQLTETAYDARGLVASVTRFAATDSTGAGLADGSQSVTSYVHDAAGRLLQVIAPRGTGSADPNDYLTAYAYDGLGRTITVTQYDASGVAARQTVTSYTDASRQVTLTLSNGLCRVSTYDSRGLLLTVVEQNGAAALSTTQYQYDGDGRLRIVTDPNGNKTCYFYDAAGRKAGELDATGALTETIYNANGQVLRTIAYATRSGVDIGALFTSDASGTVADVSLSAVRPTPSSGDQIARRIYDAAGRLCFTIDAAGAVVEHRYDGAGRQLGTIAYANKLNNASGLDTVAGEPQPADLQLLSSMPEEGLGSTIALVVDDANDRGVRSIYDKDGALRAILDAEGYLTEYRYDGAGRLVQTERYAAQVDVSLRAGATLDQLIASANASSADNVLTARYYDGQGRIVSEVDGERYLTFYAYDRQGNLTSTTRYANRVVGSVDPTAGPQVLVSAPAIVPAGGYVLIAPGQDQTTQQTWNAFNQLETSVASDGTISRNTYDDQGRLITSVSAEGTSESAANITKYDLQGRVVQVLSPVGAAALAALGGTPTQGQIDAVWSSYAITYSYDNAGRRVQARDANGNVTWYFYDADNRLTFTVRRIADEANPGQWLGEVSERRYNALGQIATDVVYAARLSSDDIALLHGGEDAPLQTVRATLSDGASDSISAYTYDADGRLATTTVAIDAAHDAITTRSYNSFGELISQQTAIDASNSRIDQYSYDRRGLQLTESDDAGGLNQQTTRTFDAFGRMIASTDGRGITHTSEYDKLGRILLTTEASSTLALTRSSSFDAFNRVVSHTDANGVVTTYAYDTATRTVTTAVDPSGLNLVTRSVSNRRGQTITLVDGAGNETRFAYDANGNLLTQTRWDTASNAETVLATNTYDAAGIQLVSSRDANGNQVTFTYDAAGRTLSRTVDAAGLNLTTRYAYDAKGQLVSVTDPRGVVTETSFDRAGRTVAVTVDPGGANLKTEYAYDLAGNNVSVTEGAGTAAAHTTQYGYDDLGRRISTIVDPSGLGLTTLYSYDGDNNVVAKLEGAGTADARLTRYAYDDANRLVYTVDALGTVSRNDYDADGRIVQTVVYANAIDPAALAIPTLDAVSALVVSSSADRTTRHRYDAAGRERFVVDALGAVTEKRYDALGNVTAIFHYANALAGTLAADELPQVLDAAGSGAYVLRSPGSDRITTQNFDAFNRIVGRTEAAGTAAARTESWAYDASGNVLRHTDVRGNAEWFAYDAANRQTRHIDALGYVTQYSYGADGKLVDETRYLNAVALPVGADDRWAEHAPAAAPSGDVESGDRNVHYVYDSAGRLASRTDAAGSTTSYGYDAVGNLVDATVAAGTAAASTLHREYDAAGRVISETRASGQPEASTTNYVYDVFGNQVSIITAVGTSGVRTTAQAFDLLGRKIAATDGNGATISTEYNAFGNIVKVTDANGAAGYFFTDALGRVTLQVNPEGIATETRYDLLGNTTDHIRYANKVTGSVDETHRPQILSAAGSGVYILADDAADEKQTSFFDALGRKTEVRTWYGAGAAEYYSERLAYDAVGNILTSTARNGAVTTYAYDADNRLIAETLPITSKNASGASVAVQNRYAYDAFGNLAQKTEAYGLPEQRITRYAYDKLNREIARSGDAINTFDPVTGSDLIVTPTQRKIYDARGNLIEEIDARGGRTLHYYDKADREIGRVDAAGTYTAWTYDPVGNKLAQIVYANAVEVAGIESISSEAPPAVAGTVPAAGAYVLTDPANDRTTHYVYDAVGRQIGTRIDGIIAGYYDVAAGIYRPSANISVFTETVHDAAGNVVKTVDGNGAVTRTYFNRAGQKTGQLDALGYLTTWTLDAWGNAVRETRYANAVNTDLTVTDTTSLAQLVANTAADAANDRVTDTTYDRMNRVVTRTVRGVATGTVNATGSLVEGTADAVTHYRYDGLNDVTQQTDATGAVIDWRYDGAGRRIEEARAAFVDYRGVSVRPTTNYEYNGLNELVRTLERGEDDATEADDRITAFSYGAGGFLASKTDPAGAMTLYRVDANGNVTQTTLVNRQTSTGALVNDVVNYRYDGLNRQVMSVDVGTGTTKEVRYNAFGEVTGKRTNGGGADRAWTEFADYDQLGRIWRGNSGDGITKVWVYDKAGNATLKIDSATTDLASLDLAHILALQSPVINQTVSVYDARNQLIDVIQPSMIGDGHQTIVIEQTLMQATGTSFAGVGNVALTEAAGLGSSNGVTTPNAVGAVSISRAQTINASMTDSYSYWFDSYGNGGITSASHSLTVSLPDSSALGSGNLRVHAEIDGAPGLGGGARDVFVAPNSSSATVSFSEGCSGRPGSGRAYRYSVYKQTALGEVQIASSSGWAPPPVWGSQTTYTSTTAMANQVFFSGQRPDAARLILMTRPANSNTGWTFTEVPQTRRNGSPVPGWFQLDWSSWNRGSYEMQYIVLDAFNNVVNSEQGQMVLSNSSPSITQHVHTVGGAGRAFMTNGGALMFTEQGATAQTLTVLYRHAGSNEAWQSQVLSPAAIGGIATRGIFQFNTAGLSGKYEYTIEAKNASGVTLNKAGATFTVGDANSVLDPSGTKALTNAAATVGASVAGVTTVSETHSDKYSYDAVYTSIMTGASHTVNMSLPDTSAWGNGAVLVTTSLQGISASGGGSLPGGSSAIWVPSNQMAASMSFSESISPWTIFGTPGARAYNYGIYKQTDNGLIYLGGSDYTTANPATSRVSQNLVAFNVQPNTATRLLMQYRRAGSNGGWSVTSVPPMTANGGVLPGRFAFDWSSWNRGAYEYRTVALDNAGNVLNSGSGTLNLQDGAPSISKTDDLIGGAGRVFMDTAGRLNFTEQGTATKTLTIRTRAAGSSGIWSTRQVLAPATVAGVATPGWFQFDPAAAGLTGNIEYVIEGRNAAGEVLQKTAGSFMAGQPSTVSALQGYHEPPPVARFNQPVSAETMVMSYRPAGSTGDWTQVSLPKSNTGVFDWDTSNVFTSDNNSADYEYKYETRDAAGTLVNQAHGGIRLGSTPSVLSHINDDLPTKISLTPPAGNAIAATATRMQLDYRLSGTATWLTTTLTRTDLSTPFVLDASSLIPPGSLGSLDYHFVLQDASGTALLADDGSPIEVSGTIKVGTAPDAQALTAVATGSTGPTVNLIHRRQAHNAFGEVVTETDGRGFVTHLVYNTQGKLTQKIDPQTTVVLANGYQQRQSPVTSWIYDLDGNLIGERDANGNVNTLRLLPGDPSFGQNGNQSANQGSAQQAAAAVATEYHADGGTKRNGYDRLGNQRYSVDEIERRTDYQYDKAGRVTRIDRPAMSNGQRAWDAYAYDAAGHRIRHSTTPNGSTVYTDTTDYDSLGRVTATATALGHRTTYGYQWSSDIVGINLQRTGGWQTTTTDALGRTMVDQADTFGRVTQHTDLGGHVFTYTYNLNGWLTQQVATSGQDITTDYYANGYVKRITDNTLGTRTDYEYDDNGNRTYEAYQRTLSSPNGGITEYLQNSLASYDELNRVKEVVDTRADIRYEYDAAGNRRHVWSYYSNGLDGNTSLQDFWYAYDAMNRFTVTMGKLTGARGTSASDASVSIVAGSSGDGVAIAYDLAGQRKLATYARDGHQEAYDFDATGHLTNVWMTAAGGSRVLGASRSNDLLGRVTSYTEYNTNGSVRTQRNSAYDADSRLLSQSGTDGSTTYSYYTRQVAGFDDTSSVSQSGAGELAKVETSNSGTTTTTWTSYAYWDEAKEATKTITGYNAALEENNALWAPGVSKLAYDVNGHLQSATDAGKDGTVGTADDIRFEYVDNAQGLTLRRDQYYGNTVGKTHQYLYLDGRGIGDFGNDGDTLQDYAQTLAQPKQTKEELYKNWKPIASGDFDQNYQPINANHPGPTATSYTVKAGDTLAGIAASMWGDSSLWYVLANANGLSATSTLKAGQVLTVPNTVTNVHNTSETYRPYSAGRIIGDTSPTLPDAPPAPVHYSSSGGGGGCGGGGFIVAIVTIVVAVVTFQVEIIPMAFQSVVGSAVVGNIAGQIVGNAIGVQHGFDWGSLAVTAITAGVMQGANFAGGLSGWQAAAVNAVAANAMGQALNMALGRQEEFSWTSLVVSAISAPIANSISESLTGKGGAFETSSKQVQTAVTSTTHALVSAVTRLAIQGGRLNWEAIAADSIYGMRAGLQQQAWDERQNGNSANAGLKAEMLEEESWKTGAAVAGQGLRPTAAETPARTMSVDEFLSDWPPSADSTPTPATVTAKSGDSISKILGTSDPVAIEAFMRRNGLSDSRIYAGRDYVMPSSGDYEASSGRMGQAVLNQDNAARQRAAASLIDSDGMRIGPTIERAREQGIYSGGASVQSETANSPTDYSREDEVRLSWKEGIEERLSNANHAAVAGELGYLGYAKHDAISILQRADKLHNPLKYRIGASGALDDAAKLLKTPTAKSGMSLLEASSTHGRYIKGLGWAGNIAGAAEDAAYIARTPSDKRWQAAGASVINVTGDAGATALGMKIGAWIGVAGGPYAPVTVPLFAGAGGFVGHLLWDENAKSVVRETVTGIPEPKPKNE